MKLHWVIDIDVIGERHQQVPAQLRKLGHSVSELSLLAILNTCLKKMETYLRFTVHTKV